MDKLSFKLLSLVVLITFFFSSSVAPVLATVTYLYDANGNMTSDGTKCYVYNQANQLIQVKTCGNNQLIAEYLYDYKGKRIIKKEYQGGTLKRTIYSLDDQYQTVKLASNGATQNTVYYEANDKTVAQKNPDGSKTYNQSDHLGSNSVISNQSGTLVQKTAYEPYGEVKSGGTLAKYQYTGQEKDQETGLNYYDSRYYDPHLQRFTQPDSVVPNAYDPQMLNRYSYVRNNPLRYTDPTGHCPGLLIFVCAAFVAADEAFFGGAILAAVVKVSAPIIQAFTKIGSSPNTSKVIQTGAKVESNSAIQKIENTVIKNGTNVGNITINAGGQLKTSISIGGKIEKQMQARGWTQESIKKAVSDPVKTVTTKDTRHLPGESVRLDDPATAYYAEDGSYVVLNDVSGDIVQISNKFDALWKAPWNK